MNIFKSELFKDQVVFVSGGGTGIGFACAQLFLELGAKVIIASRKQDKLDAALLKLQQFDKVMAFALDIRDREAVDRCFETVKAMYGRLDILVNNAGGQFPSAAENISDKGWDAVVNTNLTGTWNMTNRAFKQFFEPQGSGIIVNIIANVFRGFPGMAHTGAARAAVDNLTKTLAVEWARKGIRINSIAPGIINSSGLENYPPELVKGISDKIPVQRLGTVEEIAALVGYMSSPIAGFMTGETVYIDGGQRLWGDIWEM
jgi:citronellol/citronellal dehydrogenase